MRLPRKVRGYEALKELESLYEQMDRPAVYAGLVHAARTDDPKHGALLARMDMRLDAIVELKVDEAALLARIENRARETIAAGGAVRADDNPESFKVRLDAYRAQTAPVSAYYASKGELKIVDGMAPIDAVTAAINKTLGV